MEDCLFCKIAKHEIPSQIVHEDELTVAFKDIHPRTPVHILVVPKEHIESLDGADDRHKELLGHINLLVARLARENGIAENGYRMIVNTGPDSGQEVHHIHYHLLGGVRLGSMVTTR